MADATVNNPDGIIKKVLFPIVSERTLKDLVKELKNSGCKCQYHINMYI